jgi:hypothetical protein
MNWKLFAKSARLVNRPVRFRPTLDILEDRTVLSPVSFSIIQNQSPLELSGTIGGTDIQPQGAGALTTTYFGDFRTDIDETNGGIVFIPTGNDFCAADSGSWAPLPDGSNGTAPAIYGIQVDVSGMNLVIAIRDFHINADTGGSALPLYQNPDGSFGFPSAQTLTISAGSGTYAHPVLGQGPVNLTGLNGPNQADDGQLVDNGNGTFVITVPVSFSVSGTISGLDYVLNINGQIVGTGGYTAPGSGAGRKNATSDATLVSGTHSRLDDSPALIGLSAPGLASPSRSGVTTFSEQTPSPVPNVSRDDGTAAQVHHVSGAIVDPFTVVDLMFQDLA